MVCSTILPVKSGVSIASQLKLRKDTWARICHYQHTHWQLSLFCLQVFPSLYNISVFVCKLLGHIIFCLQIITYYFFYTSHNYFVCKYIPSSKISPSMVNSTVLRSMRSTRKKSNVCVVKNYCWLVVYLPLWKMMEWKSVGMMMTFPIYGKNSHVPNHQPAIVLMFESSWIRFFLQA